MVHRELHTVVVSLAALCLLNLSSIVAQAEERPVQVALAGTPLVLRDGREANANVVRVAFEPNSASMTSETRNQLQDLLGQLEPSCVLSVQVVGAASEIETAPRVAIDTHLLARERADTVARLARDTGIPPAALASIWSINHQTAQPKTAVWMFLDNSTPACVGKSPYLDAAPLSDDRAPTASVVVADNSAIARPLARPMRPSSADLPKHDAELHPPEAPALPAFSVSFADNSSYLGAKETAKLRQFARELRPSCTLRMKATVAGFGADAHYAGWLAERRLDRVAQLLRENVAGEISTEFRLVPNDSRRLVIVSLHDEPTCGKAKSQTFVAMQ
jgi:outer membrane protein OmpA-like peptidoglycan-associated protein